MNRLNVVWYWQTMGPYHMARMGALAGAANIDLLVVECTSLDDHAWNRTGKFDFELVTLASAELSPEVLRKTQDSFFEVLQKRRPDVIVAPGYAHPQCLVPILSYRNANRSTVTVLWSESTVMDSSRLRWKEAFKTLMLPVFDGALVAGHLHAEYLKWLRMPANDIQIVGNCVDNSYFANKSQEHRENPQRVAAQPSRDFFLFVGRLIPVKNVQTLIRAYDAYRKDCGVTSWDLVLVGGGPEEKALRELVRALRVEGIHFAGNRQVDELPQYYSRAKCFVLPSLSEPWGLVVNEAMASGLPVLASNRCGCAHDLIRDGVNGYLFNPSDEQTLTKLLSRFSNGTVPLAEFGASSEKIISNYTPALFADRASRHLQLLSGRKKRQPTSSARSRSLRRVVAENAYALFGASVELSDLATRLKNLLNRNPGLPLGH